MVVTSIPPASRPTPPEVSFAPPVMTTLEHPAPAMPLVPTSAVASFHAPTSSSNDIPECMMYKSLLHQHIQKASLPAATYRTLNEGSAHLPRFRSTVLVGEEQFTSPNVFLRRKEAEHDVAKIALECLRKRTVEEKLPPIHEGTVLFYFCKSILNEYAAKRHLERPVYNTIQVPGHLQFFVSSLVFNGVTYVGKNARTKKEAEQLAARAVILALIGSGDSTSSAFISEIIKSKSKSYATLHNSNDFQAESSTSVVSNDKVQMIVASQGALELHPPQHAFAVMPTKEAAQEGIKPVAEAAQEGIKPAAEATQEGMKPAAEAAQEGTKSPIAAVPRTIKQSPVISHHAFSVPTGEAVQQKVELPITFVPEIVGASTDACQIYGKRRRKNKKKAKKKMRVES